MKTKCLVASKLPAGFVVALTVGLAVQGFAQSETLLPSTVVRMKGHARLSTDNGKTWRMVKLGDSVGSGSMIQTAFKSELDIVLGEQARPLAEGVFYNRETQPANLVSLSEDTLLRIDKIARKRATAGSQDSVEETLLNLRTGALTGNLKKLNGGSRYEIAFVNGVAGTREGIYRLRANGEMSVLKGRAFIALADGKPAKEIAEGQQFNPGTGLVATLPPQATQANDESRAASDTRDEGLLKSAPPSREPVSSTRRPQPPSTGLRRVGP